VRRNRDFFTFQNQLESIHNGIHGWVGGTMGDISTSAYDPIFWAHHCMIDRLWYRESFEARIFIGAPRSLKRDTGTDHPAYAGSFFVFGHGRCRGEAGHCDIPRDRDLFDRRLPHHLEPGPQIVTVTEAIERLLSAGKRKAAVDVIVHGDEGDAHEALAFSRLRLLTYA
jgi:Common central domain of tyrosinase